MCICDRSETVLGSGGSAPNRCEAVTLAGRRRASACLEQALLVALPFPLFLSGALVVLFFAACEPDVDRGASPLPEEREGDEGVALAFHRADELVQLFAVQ